MQERKTSVMWERRLSAIYHCCADMPWEESCVENPNIEHVYCGSYFWFGLRNFPNSRGSQWRTGQPWRACSKAERTCKLLWYPNRLLLFCGGYYNPKKQGGASFSALPTDAPCCYWAVKGACYLLYVGISSILKSQLQIKIFEWFHKWHNFLKKLSLKWIRSSGENQYITVRSKHKTD